MAQKIEVYGVLPGAESETWLMAVYVNPMIQSKEIPARQCIGEFLEKHGCEVTSMRKVESLHHEL